MKKRIAIAALIGATVGAGWVMVLGRGAQLQLVTGIGMERDYVGVVPSSERSGRHGGWFLCSTAFSMP